MKEIARFEIPGEPRTKKNHSRILQTKDGRRFVAPSEQYKDYEHSAGWFVPCERIDYPVNVKVLYYMGSKRTVDLVNLLEATCDILQKYECVKSDDSKIIMGHDGSRVLYDKENPRAEVIIEKMEDLKWEYRDGFWQCPNCGGAFYEKTTYCPECGEKLR